MNFTDRIFRNNFRATMQTILYKSLSQENYLRVLQRGFFLAYRLGLLKLFSIYDYHYYAKKLINKGDTIIDIGANLGYYSFLFAKWTGKTGNVFAIEPVKIFNKIFVEKVKKMSNITLYSYALGSEEKTVELVSSTHVGYLRTGLPHIYDQKKDGAIETQEFRFETQMKKPSLLFNDLEKIDYIKCDIEGFEYVVLSEMKEVIRKHKPKVQVEVWGNNEEKVLALFNELGYSPYKLHKSRLMLQDNPTHKLRGDYLFLPR
jgi:FkbM family methyltransferase